MLMQPICGPHLESHCYVRIKKGRDGTGDIRFLQDTVLSPNYNHKKSITEGDPLFHTYESKWRPDKLKQGMLGLVV